MGDKCSAEHGILRDSVEGVYGCCVDRRLVWGFGLGFVSVCGSRVVQSHSSSLQILKV